MFMVSSVCSLSFSVSCVYKFTISTSIFLSMDFWVESASDVLLLNEGRKWIKLNCQSRRVCNYNVLFIISGKFIFIIHAHIRWLAGVRKYTNISQAPKQWRTCGLACVNVFNWQILVHPLRYTLANSLNSAIVASDYKSSLCLKMYSATYFAFILLKYPKCNVCY